jgi:hypothetical protein
LRKRVETPFETIPYCFATTDKMSFSFWSDFSIGQKAALEREEESPDKR